MHELWLTRLFNDYFAGPANAILNAVGVHAANPERPWVNFITMEILVAVLIVVVFSLLRTQLSVEKPGLFQQTFELIYEFLHGQSHEVVGHDGPKHLPLFGTLFIFILFANLLGVVPSFESPTMFPSVPAGCAMLAFLYYNMVGFKSNGAGYINQFVGPSIWLAPLMIPVEVVSHLARPLSLTVRLYANMLAGEKVTLIFLGLTYFLVPAVFMGLHVFVSLLQAYIFTVLMMIYVGGAAEHEH